MTLLQTDRTIIDYITLEDAAFFVTLVSSPGWLYYIGDRLQRAPNTAKSVAWDES